MRAVRYRVAASLDGYIAGPTGEIDWIIHDPTADFGAIFSQFDTALLGRHTFELTLQPGAPPWPPGWQVVVFSRTLKQADHPGVRIVADDAADAVRRLRDGEGRDIWLFGGGILFTALLQGGVVDTVEVSVIPVLLGEGIPLFPADYTPTRLSLSTWETSPAGIVTLRYAVGNPQHHHP